MKVLVSAVASSDRPDGVSRHAANLAQCLLLNEETEQVDLIVGEWQYGSMQSMLERHDSRLRLLPVAIRNSSLARNWWHWSRLPLLADGLGSDLVHAAYPVPLHKSAFGCPLVVTLHDLYPYDAPANFGYPKVFVNRSILKQCLRRADAIACVSKSTLQRLEVYAPADVIDKAVTVYNHAATRPGSAADSPVPGWRGEPFLLCVAQHRRNKNIVLAIQVFQRLQRQGEIATDARLVIVGVEGPETASIRRFVHASGLTDSVVFLRGITDAALSWCYCHCKLLLAPSALEGFGLPVLEAMLHQCRVVCSDIPAFREVGGNYCDYASLQTDPVGAFVQAARTALKSHKFRAASTECFSRPRVAEAYHRLYARLCGEGLSLPRTDGVLSGALIEGRER